MTAKRARRVRWIKAITRQLPMSRRLSRLWLVKPQKPGPLYINRRTFDHWHPDLRHWDWNRRRMDGKRGFW